MFNYYFVEYAASFIISFTIVCPGIILDPECAWKYNYKLKNCRDHISPLHSALYNLGGHHTKIVDDCMNCSKLNNFLLKLKE